MKGRCLATAVLSLVLSDAMAQEEPIVRVEVTPEEVAVGESALMRVTVLVPTWFPQPPVFPSFELSNAITRLPPDSSYPTSERVGRGTWSGIVRNYRVYPMLGATYRLAGQSIRVTYANPGSDPIVVDAAVPEIEVRGVVPAGAGNLDPYLAGRRFSLSREIEADLDNLGAGDAIVVRYVAELEGLPSVFIPPLVPDIAAPGMAVYADEPVVEEGDPAVRTETVTLVFEAGGDFSLPGRRIDWWNSESQSVATAAIDPLSFSVTGPALSPAPAIESREIEWRNIAALVLIAGLLLVFSVRLWPAVSRRRAAARVAYRQSEQFAYRQLQAALNDGGTAETHRALLTWVARIAPGCELRQFAKEYGDDEFAKTLSAFIASLYAESETTENVDRLAPGIASARHNCLRQRETASTCALPPLNP